ncbi:MAG: cell division protein FtsL [Acidobacteria bacterium]|nr:cell division protein FtsL [Acidobacteriota bacterium]
MSHRAEAPRLLINARMVKEKDRARARELRRLLLCGAAILVPLLVYVWQRVDFLRVSYQVEALKKERQDLQEKNKHLSVERSFLMSPDRIERMARKELGMVDPSPSDVRRVAVIDGRINQVQARGGSPGGEGRGTPGAAPPDGGAGGEAGGVIEAGIGIIRPVGTAAPRRPDDRVRP